jgi:hypothetical protein
LRYAKILPENYLSFPKTAGYGLQGYSNMGIAKEVTKAG